MAIHQAKKEIPWCTVFLVTGALVSHALVLSGNLATARAFNVLGQSTGGWSNVGQDLSGSLHTELDRIMTEVTAVLTNAIGTLTTVQQGVDSVLGIAGSVTDTSLATWQTSSNRSGVSSALQQQAAVETTAMPKGEGGKKDELDEKGETYGGKTPEAHKAVISKTANSLVEEEVFFMGQIGPTVVRQPEDILDLASILDKVPLYSKQQSIPAFDAHSVERLTATTVTGAMAIWQTARTHAAVAFKNQAVSNFPTPTEFAEALKIMISNLVHQLTGLAGRALDTLFEIIRPALLQIGKWVINFGTKVTDKINSFMTSLDNVQKIIDQIMSQINPASAKGKAGMMHETYNLFDASNTGYISVQDLKDVGEMYGINALAGSKAESIFREYDVDGNGRIVRSEFDEMVDDSTVPNIMATVLRYYAKRLSTIAGVVGSAHYRDEVAEAVVDYLALVCAKNMTKVGWVSETLTNRSLPAEFSADVMVQLAQNLDNPDQLTTADVGSIVMGEMLRLNPTYVGQLLALIEDTTYWSHEGFDPDDQPKVVQRVTAWISNTPEASAAMSAHGSAVIVNGTIPPLSFLETSAESSTQTIVELTQEQLSALPAARHAAAVERVKIFRRSKVIAKRMRIMSQPVTPTVMALRLHLGMAVNDDPQSEESVQQGVPARPETLEFAQYLSANATQTAQRFVRMCFDYTSESSSPLDSFAVQIKNMVKKVQNFISLMQEYSGPKGIQRLQDEIHSFTANAAKDMLSIINQSIDERVTQFISSTNVSSVPSTVQDLIRSYGPILDMLRPQATASVIEEEASISFLNVGTDDQSGSSSSSAPAPAPAQAPELIESLGLGQAWSTLQYSLSLLSSSLPTVVEDLKYARKEVSAVVKTLDSIFSSFSDMGPPIFDKVASLYKMIWVLYFVLFFTLTFFILFYGMWASGFMGGPKASANVEGEEWYDRPQGFRDRCKICCACCDACLRGCHDSHLCFWSWIIVFQIIVLVLFVVSIVLCILAGVKAFITAGCSEVYLLGDASICTGTLDTVRQFLLTFLSQGAYPLAQTCEKQTLLTCQLIGKKLQTSAIITVIGSLIAAVFSFQLVVESAILHERARWRRIFDEESKRV